MISIRVCNMCEEWEQINNIIRHCPLVKKDIGLRVDTRNTSLLMITPDDCPLLNRGCKMTVKPEQ